MSNLELRIEEEANLGLTISESSDMSFDAVDFVGVPFAPTVEVEDIEGGHRVSITSMGADGKKTDEFDVMDGETWLSGNILTGTLSEAAVLTADDAYAAPPKGVSVYGKSVQDGTPTPDAPVTIQSVDNLTLNVCGKNLLPKYSAYTVNGITFTVANDGAVTVNGTATGTVNYPAVFIVPKTGTYTLSGCPSGGGASSVQLWTADQTAPPDAQITDTGSGGTGTLTRGHMVYVRLRVQNGYTCNNLVFRPQLELGSTATPYQPYVGQSVQIPLSNHIARSLPDGTCDTLTLAYQGPSEREGWGVYSKTLVQRVWHVDDVSTLSVGMFDADRKFIAFYAPKQGVNTTSSPTINVQSPYYQGARLLNKPCCYVAGSGNLIIFGNDDFADRATAVSMLSGVSLDYQLATPVTHDLGTVELPVNPAPDLTAWADGGSAQPTLSMVYEQDINIVIGELRAALADALTS